MALNDYETAAERGKPVELYQFTYGLDAGTPLTLSYTDSSASITHAGVVYAPLPIKRTAIKSNGKLAAGDVKITVPRSSAIAELFRVYPPRQIVTVKLRQGHVANVDDPSVWALGENFPVAWVGRLLEVRRDRGTAQLTCEPVSASMRRPGLRRHYQWPCPLALYGSRCNAGKEAAKTTAPASALSANRIAFADAAWIKSGRSAADYVGGLVTWVGEYGVESRSILRTSDAANTLTCDGPVIGLAVADTVTVYLGCPRTLAGCETLHDNVVNYGGQAFIPVGSNPLGKNNHF